MRIHSILHVPFEGAGSIAEWAVERGHTLTDSIALTEEFPALSDVDWLVVMGGPMAADDEAASPWLAAEKRYIAEAVAAGKLVLGVCLGAQVLAEVLGGRVKRNPEREIGWYPVTLSPAGIASQVFRMWPTTFLAGHWHGDTFELPEGIPSAASSEACPNQAFVTAEDRVVGMQFHLEWDGPALAELVGECSADFDGGGRWVQPIDEFLDHARGVVPCTRDLLFALLDEMAFIGPKA